MLGDRIQEERNRLGMTQEAFAHAAGAKRRTLIDWEKGKTSPTAVQLVGLVDVGVDPLYVLLARRSPEFLTPDEESLLVGYRSLDARGRAGVLGMIAGFGGNQIDQQFNAPVGQVAHGDIHITGRRNK